MPQFFIQFFLMPLIKYAIESAFQSLGPKAANENIVTAAIQIILKELDAFTHATTKPSDFVSSFLTELEILVNSTIKEVKSSSFK